MAVSVNRGFVRTSISLFPYVLLFGFVGVASNFALLSLSPLVVIVLLLLSGIACSSQLPRAIKVAVVALTAMVYVPLVGAMGLIASAQVFIATALVPVVLVAFVLFYVSSPMASLWGRLSMAVLATMTLSSVSLFVTARMLQEPVALTVALPEHDTDGIIQLFGARSKRYSFAFSQDAQSVAVTHPHSEELALYAVADMRQPLKKYDNIDVMYFATNQPPDVILAAGMESGLHVLDPLTFESINTLKLQTEKADKTRFQGIVYDEKMDRIILLRANCELSFISASDYELYDQRVPSELSLPVYEAVCDNIFMSPKKRRLFVTTDSGTFYTYNLDTLQLIESVFVFGPQGNAVFSMDEESVYIAAMFNGYVYKISAEDGQVVDKMFVGGGLRYINRIPDSDILMVSNYFAGSVSFVDLEQHSTLGKVTVGPRIKWLAMIPGTSQCLVSNALGLSVIDTKKVLEASPPIAEEPYHFPYYLLGNDSLQFAFDSYTKLDLLRVEVILLLIVFLFLSGKVGAMPLGERVALGWLQRIFTRGER